MIDIAGARERSGGLDRDLRRSFLERGQERFLRARQRTAGRRIEREGQHARLEARPQHGRGRDEGGIALFLGSV